MPPLEGFADVGQRLSAVRRRVNRLLLLDTLCGALAAGGLVMAALIAVGMWGSSAAFRLTLAAALTTAAGTGLVAARYARRRWVDLAGAASLADRRADLSDRLTTVATLPADGSASPLAPLLVEQTLHLDARWRPEVIAPLRVPRPAVALVAVLVGLAALLVFLRTQPRHRPTADRSPASASGVAANAASGERPPPARSLPGGAPPGAAGQDATTADARAETNPAPDDDVADEATTDTAGSGATGALAAWPAQLQHAIRAAVRGEQAGKPTTLAAASPPGQAPGPGGDAGTEENGRGAAQAAGTPRSGSDAASRLGKDARDQPPGDADQQHSGASSRTGDARPAPPQQNGHDGNSQPPSGAAPPAGAGSSAGNLLGTTPGGSAPSSGATGSFKVTITSFLKALDQPPTTQRSSTRRAGAGPAARTAPSLSDTQLADDLLRKADVPPEYEELVRRVYSTREEP